MAHPALSRIPSAILGPLALAIGTLSQEAEAMVIVQDGQPRAVIVTAAEPGPSAARAAAELKHFVEAISGAELPVYAGAEAVPPDRRDHARLHVGRSEAVSRLGVEPPSGHDRDATGEGFVLRTAGPRDLVLAGNEDAHYRGTEYAVYELLERLGCRWYFPGEFGQILPRQETITVPDLDVEQRPSFVARNIWMSGWADDTGDHPDWLVRNKGTLARPFAFAGDGSIGRLAPPEIYEEAHPEIYAMGPDGQRRSRGPKGELHLTMLCVTNPLTVEIAVRTIKEYFRGHPEANSYGFSAPDWSPRCHCDVCVAGDHGFTIDSGLQESISDAYFNFVNNVAHGVNAEFPDRYIVILAYDNRVRPPEGLDRPWNRNIVVQLARLGVSALRPIPAGGDIFARRHERTIRAWARIAPKMVIYDYDPHSTLNRMPFWNVHSIRANLPFYHENSVVGFTTEGHNTFLRTGLNYYVRARLMWDVNADVDALVDDFHERFFGPAEAPMRAFFDQVEGLLAASPEHVIWTSKLGDWTRIYPPEATLALGSLLDRAEALADTPPLRRRVAAYRALHEYMITHNDMVTRVHEGRYLEALTELERLSLPVEAAEAIQPGLLPPEPRWVMDSDRGPEHLAPLHRGPGGARRAADSAADWPWGPPPRGSAPTCTTRASSSSGTSTRWPRTWSGTRSPVTTDWTQGGYRDAEGYAYPRTRLVPLLGARPAGRTGRAGPALRAAGLRLQDVGLGQRAARPLPHRRAAPLRHRHRRLPLAPSGRGELLHLPHERHLGQGPAPRAGGPLAPVDARGVRRPDRRAQARRVTLSPLTVIDGWRTTARKLPGRSLRQPLDPGGVVPRRPAALEGGLEPLLGRVGEQPPRPVLETGLHLLPPAQVDQGSLQEPARRAVPHRLARDHRRRHQPDAGVRDPEDHGVRPAPVVVEPLHAPGPDAQPVLRLAPLHGRPLPVGEVVGLAEDPFTSVPGPARTDDRVHSRRSKSGHGPLPREEGIDRVSASGAPQTRSRSLARAPSRARPRRSASPLTKVQRAISRSRASCSMGSSPSGLGPTLSTRLPPLARVSISSSISCVPDL